MKNSVEKLLIKKGASVKETIKKMDEIGERILFVIDDDNRLCGSVTDGDLRRWILKEGKLTSDISQVYNPAPIKIEGSYDLRVVHEMMNKKKIIGLPVIDRNQNVVDVIFATDGPSDDKKQSAARLNIPVLVMAGGKGTRLDPFTKILPKPLIPFGDKPIVEIIMNRFTEFGCSSFYLTVNYKGKMIQSYFDNADNTYDIKYIWEEIPCGTAGSLRLAEPLIDAPHLFVSNCDILIKADYADIFQFHQSNKNDITVIGSMQHVSVPYGVLEMKNGGTLQNIIEKPEYDLLVNTGMYLIRREVISHVPENIKFDFPELLLKVKASGGRVGVYPISQQSWVDIGQWQEYHNAIKNLEATP